MPTVPRFDARSPPVAGGVSATIFKSSDARFASPHQIVGFLSETELADTQTLGLHAADKPISRPTAPDACLPDESYMTMKFSVKSYTALAINNN